jgi:hypothetical protein
MKPCVGDRVRIERDEKFYPSRRTWPQFRGRTGTVVEINYDERYPHLTEWGVVFGNVKPRTERPHLYQWSGDEPITWFKDYEIAATTSVLASQINAEPRTRKPGSRAVKPLNHGFTTRSAECTKCTDRKKCGPCKTRVHRASSQCPFCRSWYFTHRSEPSDKAAMQLHGSGRCRR